MKRRAEEGSRPEAWDWLEPDDTWEPEAREQASRRFFQVWNGIQGETMDPEKPRATSTLRANVPLRCTVWRGRVRRFGAILTDLILKDQEGLLAIYEKGFDEIYGDLQGMAQGGDPAALEALQKIDTLLGRGSYKGEGIRPRLETTVEEHAGKIKGRNISEQRAAVDMFFNELQHWPALQKKYLDRVVEDVWTDYSKRGGYDTGTSMAGGEMRTNRLFTFYLMKDPYPYLVSIPTADPSEVTESNTPENPLEGQAYKSGDGVTPTFDETTYFEPTEGLQIYVQNVPNPDYDFMKITPKEVGTQKATANKIREKVTDLQRQSMYGNVYLSANVLEDSPAFEGLQGIGLLELGREGTYDIADHERDVTKLPNGGLFRIPEGGLPEEKTYYPKLLSKEKAQQRKAPPKSDEGGGKYEFKTSSRNLFAESLLEVFGQEAAMPELWFDDEGNEYGSAEEVMAAYDQQAWEEFQPQAKEMIKQIIEQDLGAGAQAPAPSNIVQMPQAPVEEVQEVEEDFYGEEVPVSEEQLPVAARHVIRLVRVAKQLDAQGFYKEADKVDDIVRGIIEQLTQ